MKFDIEDHQDTIRIEDVRPIEDFLLIEVLRSTKSKAGLILPKGDNTETCIGRVVATGPGICFSETGAPWPMPWKPGDVVLTMQYMGERLERRGKEYRFIRNNGIWARLELGDQDGRDVRKVFPAKDCILIEPEFESKSQGGIVLPKGDSHNVNCRGNVLAVNDGWPNPKTGAILLPSVKPGQQVLFRRYAGCDIEIRDRKQKVRLLQDADLYAVLED